MRVLVIDDDRLVVTSLKTILEADAEIQVVGTVLSGGRLLNCIIKQNLMFY